MKVITEERLKKYRDELSAKGQAIGACTIALLMNDCLEEIDTLTPKETDLVLAAEKYAEKYNGDDRQDIKTDVLNAFYHGAYFNFEKVMQGDTLTVSKLRPMCDAKEGEQILAFKINEKVFLNICCPDITNEFCKAFSGWIPMPIYKPELTGEVDQCE